MTITTNTISPSTHSSVLWECVAITPCPEGGSILEFVWKQTRIGAEPEALQNTLLSKQEAIFPALEFKPISDYLIGKMQNGVGMDLFSSNSSKEYQIFVQTLGYRWAEEDGVLKIFLPDRAALLNKWEKCCKLDPSLPPLSILDSHGIASDLEFIKAFFENDGLLSSEEEFIHDQCIHILRVIDFAFNLKEKYPETLKRFKTLLRRATLDPLKWVQENKIELPYNQLIAVAGMIVDTYSAHSLDSLLEILKKSEADQFAEISLDLSYFFRNELWNGYLKKRLQLTTLADLEKSWYKMHALYLTSKTKIPLELVENYCNNPENDLAECVEKLYDFAESQEKEPQPLVVPSFLY